MPIISGIHYTIFEGREVGPPAIVLIHGAGSSRLIWPRELRRMRGHRVLTMDLPGHGKSNHLVVGQSLHAYAIQIIDFIISLEINRVYLVGHSMGGAIALSIASRYPQLIAGMVLISSGASFNVNQDWLTTLGNPDTMGVAAEHFRRYAFSVKTKAEIVELVMGKMETTRSSVIYADWLACSEFDIREQVDQIKTKTKLIWGADDRITPLSNAHYLINQMPHADLEIFPDAGHMAVLEQHLAIAESIQKYFTQLEKKHTS